MKLIFLSCIFSFPRCFAQIVEDRDFYRYSSLMTKVSGSIADRYYAHCSFILYPNNVTDWYKTRQMFLVAKTLSKSEKYQQQVIVTMFQKFIQLYRIRKNASRCPHTLFVIFAWTEDTRRGMEEVSKEIPMADYLWLVFLRNEEKTESFLKDVKLPFDIRLILARVHKDDNVELEEAYRVSEGYPLCIFKYGSWNESVLVAPTSLSIYARRRDLEGYPVRVSSKEDDPISTVERIDGELKVGGYFGLIFYALEEAMNFTSVYVDAVENFTGTENEDGTWNGLVGMLQRDELDVAAGPITFARDNMRIVDFIHPLLKTNYQVFFKEEGTVLEWDAILKPFHKYVWMVLFACSFVGLVALNFFYKLGWKYGYEEEKNAWEFSMINCFFIFTKAICQQSNAVSPDSWPCRIVFITCYLTSSVLLTAYSAALISYLTTVPPVRPFDSLETMLQDGTYTVVAIEKSSDFSYFSEAKDELRKAIYDKMVEKVPKEHIFTKEDGVDQVCYKHKYALFITYAVTQITARDYSQEKGCNILHFSQHLDKLFITPSIKKEYVYGRLIEYLVLIMETAGILQKLQKEAWPLQKKSEGVNFMQVNLEEVAQVESLLLCGIILSCIVLIFEIVFSRFRSRYSSDLQLPNINRPFVEKPKNPFKKLLEVGLISDGNLRDH